MNLSNTDLIVSPSKTNSERFKPVRSFRASDSLWEMVRAESEARAMGISFFIRYALIKAMGRARH